MSKNNTQKSCIRKFDIAIVGAGAVGILMAIKLGRAGKKILLLESGEHHFSKSAHELNNVVQIGRPHNGATEGRARVVGGTTTLWGGQLTKFTRSDFQKEINGKKLWPIEYDELDELYKEVSRIVGLDINQLSDSSLPATDKISEKEEGDLCQIFYTRWLKEPNFFRLFFPELGEKSNVHLISDAHVRNILFCKNNSRVISVVATDSHSNETEYFADDFILANGTIEISRLLLLIAKRNETTPWANNSNVGAFFQDHIDVGIGNISKIDASKIINCFENLVINGYKYQPKIRLNDLNAACKNSLNIAFSMQFKSKYVDDIALLKHFLKSLRSGRLHTGLSLKRLFGIITKIQIWIPIVWRYIKHRRVMAFTDGGINVIAHCEQDVIKNSQISLHPTLQDRFGDPLAVLDWRINIESQVKALHEQTDILKRYLKYTFNVNLKLDDWVISNTGLPDDARDSYHQCGGARMSTVASEGVVDLNGRVHGCVNLYIAGAAIFPSSSFANPTFTAMAIALKTCNKILNYDNEI